MIDLGKNLKLPAAVFEQHMAVLGKTRAGKSSVLRLFVENLLDRKQRVCVIDPKGDWHGLRASADGKRAGYGVVIFGGSRADLPLNEHAGKSVAELVATGNRPCVIDLGGWLVAERTRFFIEFASTLFRAIDAPLHLVIDEAHNFAPQGKVLDPDAGKMLHWANRLASEGAGKGLTLFSASQRPQKVHKDYLTCAETLIAMRVIHVLDRNAVKDWIDGAGDDAKGREVLKTLATMGRGEGWLWSPEARFGPERIKFPLFRTYDSFAAPKAGESRQPLKGWADVDLADVKAKLAAVVEQAKANDPSELKRQLAELRRQLAAKAPAPIDPAVIDRAVQAATIARDAEWRPKLEASERAKSVLARKLSKIAELASVNGEAAAVEAPAPVVQRKAQPAPPKIAAPKPVVPRVDTGLNKAQQRIIDALAWYESLGNSRPTLTQVGAVALVDPTGGYFSNLVGPLSTEGFVERGGGSLCLTDSGRALAQPLEGADSLDQYHDVLRARVRNMRSAGNKTIEVLNVIIAAGGDSLSTEQIGERVGIDPTGGYFSNTIGPLSTAGLITRRAGTVTPTDVLFPAGLG